MKMFCLSCCFFLVFFCVLSADTDPDYARLLIFPEGVCVNNDYCVMFKKGPFEIEGVEICPIAIKYNKVRQERRREGGEGGEGRIPRLSGGGKVM